MLLSKNCPAERYGRRYLWFMPITPISMEKRKGTLGSYYACSDYTAYQSRIWHNGGF